jgi:DNA-binding SARP family transcriptional activator
MGSLRIGLLGGFSLELDGKRLPPIPSRTARSLFALLVTQRGAAKSRDFLAGTFWPDLPEARARRRLSHALWQLQQVLGEASDTGPYIVVDADTVAFNSQAGFWLDVDEFARLASGSLAEMEAAIEIYRGDFLAGLYDDWLFMEQRRVSDDYVELLERIVDDHKSRGAFGRALVYARRLVSHNPLHEEAHREVMRLCFLLGQFNEAIQQYEFCASILEEELGAQPAAATRALHKEILDHRAKGDRPFAPDPRAVLFQPGGAPIVGRVEERAGVVGRMAGVFAGRGGFVLVEGSSGVGVSRFLRGLAEDAHWRGLSVMQAKGRRTALPYDLCRQALGDALSPLRSRQIATAVPPVWLDAASTVIPGLRHSGEPSTPLRPDEEGERVAQGLTEILLAFGSLNPHVVLFDDVHLADSETLVFLKQAAHRLYSSNVLVVLGYHSQEARAASPVWEALLDIDARPGTDRLVLGDLDAIETAELVRIATGNTADGALIDSVFMQTGGNPLLVLEALRATAHHPDSAEVLPLTPAATDLLERRLRAVPTATLRILQAASVFHMPVPIDAISVVAGVDQDEALHSADDALRRAFFVEDRDNIEFVHVQMKAATYSTIPDSDRAPLHRRAAEWIADTHPDRAEELAVHLREAGEPGRAAHFFAAAADQAVEILAIDTAARHLTSSIQAADEAGIVGSELIELLLRYEKLCDQSNRRTEQAAVLERLTAAVTESADQLEVARRHVIYLANTDSYDEADAVAKAGLALAADADLPPGGLLAARGLAMSWSGRPADAMPYLEQATTSVEMSQAEIAEVRYSLGVAMSSLDHPGADAELDEALRLFRELRYQRRVADVLGLKATNHASRGEIDLAETQLRDAIEICRQIGFTQGEGLHLGNLAALHYLSGRPAEALRGFDAALSAFETVPNPRSTALTLNNAAFVRHRIVGDDAAAADQATQALEYYLSVDNPRGVAQAAAILARITARDDPAGALLLLGEHLDGFVAPGSWTTAHINRAQAEIHLSAGDLAGARHHCDLAYAAASAGDLHAALATIEGLSAQIALAAEDGERALAEARRSLEHLGPGVEQPYLLHFGLYQAAVSPAERETALSAAFQGLLDVLEGFPPAERRMAEAVPEHAAIIAAWSAYHSVYTTLEVDAATGEDPVTIRLTVSTPDDNAVPMKQERRRRRVTRMLAEASQQGGHLSAAQLATLLGVSPATIRRDLVALRP